MKTKMGGKIMFRDDNAINQTAIMEGFLTEVPGDLAAFDFPSPTDGFLCSEILMHLSLNRSSFYLSHWV